MKAELSMVAAAKISKTCQQRRERPFPAIQQTLGTEDGIVALSIGRTSGRKGTSILRG
jgi:hypothetical protein